jgi:hypothetical protein
LDERDRTELNRLGFKQLQGDHFLYTFRDGEKWPVEFPNSVVDGDVMHVSQDAGEVLAVISTESLALDRVRLAADRTHVTFKPSPVSLLRTTRAEHKPSNPSLGPADLLGWSRAAIAARPSCE